MHTIMSATAEFDQRVLEFLPSYSNSWKSDLISFEFSFNYFKVDIVSILLVVVSSGSAAQVDLSNFVSLSLVLKVQLMP